MGEHIHGVLTQPEVEPLDWECATCWEYAAAEAAHRDSTQFHLEVWPCLGCNEGILVEISPVGCTLTGHTWANELCLISWETACKAADVIREAVCEE